MGMPSDPTGSAVGQAGLAPSRQRAKELIAEGQVLVNGVKAVKPSYQAPADAVLEILGEPYPIPAGLG